MKSMVTTKIDIRGVTTITLNRPEKHNAFDDQMVNQLTSAFEQTTTNPNSRVLILAAAGKTFSAGADLHWMKRMGKYSYKENLKDAGSLAYMLKILNEIPLPTIARIQGPAFGGALGLISCCDIAIAATKASFAFSEVKIGLIPATISPYIIEAIGSRAARRYFMTGEKFEAQQAVELGLINEAVEETQLDNTIAQFINTLLGNSPTAMHSAKQLVQDIRNRSINDELIKETCERIADIRRSKEGQEGLSAFLEKRKPHWRQDN
ncbi:MAG: gamma-carboxygeranoyl-CoA hydratase [Porticoccaceae bacterium]|nr:MAG: gamma-carboxygeranoyl-CoA hydratase [Porticoccaceae bacterium]